MSDCQCEVLVVKYIKSEVCNVTSDHNQAQPTSLLRFVSFVSHLLMSRFSQLSCSADTCFSIRRGNWCSRPTNSASAPSSRHSVLLPTFHVANPTHLNPPRSTWYPPDQVTYNRPGQVSFLPCTHHTYIPYHHACTYILCQVAD